MIKTLSLFALLTLISLLTQAQIISQFDWNNSSNPVTQATVGPNATSVSTYAVSTTGGSTLNGASANNGLNAGAGRHDIDLVVPGAVFISEPGLDISVDFLKEENGAGFFTLGGLDFGISGGAIYIKFLLKVGGSDVAVSNTNVASVPDALFHTYRFIYNNTTGKAVVYIDGVSRYTYQAAAGTTLSWTGATNATIASGMDGGNSSIPVIDNVIIQRPAVTLPLSLLSFDAHSGNSGNTLSWTTDREVNTRNFVVERSLDGISFEAIGTVAAGQREDAHNDYLFTDNTPAAVNFYRLKMVDIDGSFSYSAVRKCSPAASVSIHCYPNPTVDEVHVQIDHSAGTMYYSAMSLDGKVLQSGIIQTGNGQQTISLNLRTVPRGMYLIRLQPEEGNTTVQTFKILKQ